MAPKTRAEIQRAYRERLAQRKGVATKKPKKSRREIQKDYRENQKKKSLENYLEKERKRKRMAYVPTTLLDESELTKRRKINREKARRHRELKKTGAVPLVEDDSKTEMSSSVEKPKEGRLIVKLDFRPPTKRTSSRKRFSRGLARAYKKIACLESSNEKLQKKAWKLEKKIQRTKMQRKSTKTKHQALQPSPKTPRSKANADIRKVGLSPRNIPHPLRKKLVFAEVVVDEVKAALNSNQKKTARRDLAASIISGNILKKYRCVLVLSKAVGMNRRTLQKTKEKLIWPERKREAEKQKNLDKTIKEFLERDDNSRMMPGKGDYKICKGVKVQKRFLNDYMHNLHAKFKAENPTIKISRSMFCRRRPKYIIPTSFSSRRTCLCQHHQNMALKLRAIKAVHFL